MCVCVVHVAVAQLAVAVAVCVCVCRPVCSQVTQNKHRLIETPSQEACQTLSFGATECSAVTEDGETKCSCIYPDMQSCNTWFESHFHLRPVISEVGMLLLAGEGCDCFDEAESFDQHFRCHFENLQEVPSIKASKEATMALKIP